jgi:hypothetical protein
MIHKATEIATYAIEHFFRKQYYSLAIFLASNDEWTLEKSN